jgi:uncharacterized membrane protein YsdA (DUF1294 family)
VLDNENCDWIENLILCSAKQQHDHTDILFNFNHMKSRFFWCKRKPKTVREIFLRTIQKRFRQNTKLRKLLPFVFEQLGGILCVFIFHHKTTKLLIAFRVVANEILLKFICISCYICVWDSTPFIRQAMNVIGFILLILSNFDKISTNFSTFYSKQKPALCFISWEKIFPTFSWAGIECLIELQG